MRLVILSFLTYLGLLHQALSGLVDIKQDDHGDPKKVSWSTTVQSGKYTPAEAAKQGFDSMSQKHKSENPRKPSIVSALQVENHDRTYLSSSLRGGMRSTDNLIPPDLHEHTKAHLNNCEDQHGGKHGTGANCGEVRVSDNFFKDNPDHKHIQGGVFAAYGHPGGNLNAPPKLVPPCSGGGSHSWGCKQFIQSVTKPLPLGAATNLEKEKAPTPANPNLHVGDSSGQENPKHSTKAPPKKESAKQEGNAPPKIGNKGHSVEPSPLRKPISDNKPASDARPQNHPALGAASAAAKWSAVVQKAHDNVIKPPPAVGKPAEKSRPVLADKPSPGISPSKDSKAVPAQRLTVEQKGKGKAVADTPSTSKQQPVRQAPSSKQTPPQPKTKPTAPEKPGSPKNNVPSKPSADEWKTVKSKKAGTAQKQVPNFGPGGYKLAIGKPNGKSGKPKRSLETLRRLANSRRRQRLQQALEARGLFISFPVI